MLGSLRPVTTEPSFDLGQDHLDLKAWVHEFAANVVRPAAAEWDEREEFPWPVVEEAAKIGLYSLDFFATQSLMPTIGPSRTQRLSSSRLLCVCLGLR